MPRTALRVLAAGLLLGGATALAQTGSFRGFTKLEAKAPSDPGSRLGQLQEGRLKTTGPDQKANTELFKAFARHHVYKATDEKYYFQPETGDLKARDQDSTFDKVLLDITGRLLQPGPGSNYSTDQKEYSEQFGAALNEAIREVLAKNPPTPIRVNAGRLLALGAKSGAPAFAPTIHELLTDSFPLDKGKPGKTPPELLLHAIAAAGNLFGAFDPVWQLNSNWETQYRHSFPLKDQIILARDLLNLVEKGPAVAELAAVANPDKPVIKQAPLTVGEVPPVAAAPAVASAAEQAEVVGYFRRAAVRALTKVRPDLLGEVGQPPLKPGLAIARIAVGDAKITPAPTAPEVGEAMIGLCYLAPSQKMNLPEVLAALAAGGRTMAVSYNNRETDPANRRFAKLVPWKLFAERLNAGLDHLTKLGNSNPRWREHRAAIAQLAATLRDDLITPLRKDDATIPANPERMIEFVRNRSGLPPAERSLYADDPTATAAPRPAGS